MIRVKPLHYNLSFAEINDVTMYHKINIRVQCPFATIAMDATNVTRLQDIPLLVSTASEWNRGECTLDTGGEARPTSEIPANTQTHSHSHSRFNVRWL